MGLLLTIPARIANMPSQINAPYQHPAGVHELTT